ncbi:CASP-like protein 5C1 [Rutidosis leptorrhynchoides]|uniref:CASP-like protein 5C1 n=1 Tax=Rutidosis leptorrhynchoides TaxID=125765 RepID=UPI003A996ACA
MTLPDSMGTSAGFTLRLGQTIFSSASLLLMSFGVQFYSYTSFCFLTKIKGLVILWSFALVLLDGYFVLVTHQIRQNEILLLVVIRDWWLSTLTLGAASSAASVVDILLTEHKSVCSHKICSQYLLSTIFAFLLWFLSMASSLFNLWLLPSL